jgi:hypothetical protein
LAEIGSYWLILAVIFFFYLELPISANNRQFHCSTLADIGGSESQFLPEAILLRGDVCV